MTPDITEYGKLEDEIAQLKERLRVAERDAALARAARDHANECEAEWRLKYQTPRNGLISAGTKRRAWAWMVGFGTGFVLAWVWL